MKITNRNRLTTALTYLLLALLGLFMLFPFYWMLRSSFMSEREILTVPIQWLPSSLKPDNYISAFQKAPFHRYLLNSAFLVLVNILGSVFSASFVAFGFTRLRFRGRNFWFAVLLSTMMIPY